jgi:2-polyprenyl-3-methyl-5-hydroxy-6-metoxy-1,4-benzoquinol methylase
MASQAHAHSSIDPAEVERFSRIAAEWWDPRGKFAPLHKFNPTRLSFIRDQALHRFARDGGQRRPFEGLRLLDIGCGGGLLSEPMSRLGFTVVGVDASERNIGTATTHAAEQGVVVDYRCSTAEALLAAGSHDWSKFLKPDELRGFLADQPVVVDGPYGVVFDPLSGRWSQSHDAEVNYMMTVARDVAA